MGAVISRMGFWEHTYTVLIMKSPKDMMSN